MSDPVRELKQELLSAAERRWGDAVSPSARDRSGAHRVRSRVLVVAALLSVAVAVSLFFTSPWKSPPGFSLEAVQAALAPPEGTILHASSTFTRTSLDYGCTVTLGPSELWADLSAPYRYRLIDSFWPSDDAVDRRSAACDENESVTTELGGTLGHELRFEPPDKLLPYGPGFQGLVMDDVAHLRSALAYGRAHVEGPVELDGRVVERIRLDTGAGGLLYYVDRETLIPVQVEYGGGVLFPSDRVGYLRFDVVRHYSTYEFLPRTDDNLALTDIRAQHPDAIGP